MVHWNKELTEVLLNAILVHATDPIYFKDRDSRFICANQALAGHFGLGSPEQLLGKSDSDFFSTEHAQKAYEDEQRIIASGHPLRNVVEKETWRESDDTWAMTSKWPLIGADGAILGTFGISRDITDQVRLEMKLRESEERYMLALLGINDGIWDWNLESGALYFSERLKKILGYKSNEIGNSFKEWMELVHPEQRKFAQRAIEDHKNGKTQQLHCELQLKSKSGPYVWTLWRGAAIHDHQGKARRMAGSMSDISEFKEMVEALERSAMYDQLTELPNRFLFTDRLSQVLIESKRYPDMTFALFFLDMDRFKLVNDSYGHLVGDELLRQVAQRLLKCVRKNDTVSRIAGDEFTILLERVRTINEAVLIAERIIGDLSQPYYIANHELFINASIGITFSKDGNYFKIDDVLRDADIALYRAKETGRARFVIFDEKMQQSVSRYLETEQALRVALKLGQLALHYQPVISLENGELRGFEALLRWDSPVEGMNTPQAFIPVAEESGLIIPIGEWVIRESCRQMSSWREKFTACRNLYVSINISSKQFSSPSLSAIVEESLKAHQLSGKALHFEVSEKAILRDPSSIVHMLKAWKALGIFILLDDYGTGDVSINQLLKLPLDYVKIDRTLVQSIDENIENQKMVRVLLRLSELMNFGVIAEGAETKLEIEKLKEYKCDFVQGYYISKPLPPDQVEEFLQTYN